MMKPETLYQKLKELSEKLSVEVSEQNFRSTGSKARSGLCKIHGRNVFFVDKHLPLRAKTEALAACLGEMPLEQVFMVPAVRVYIDACRAAETVRHKSD